MRCPACDRSLTEHTIGEFQVDICSSGCRGIWFDRFELQKVDEAHENLGERLLELASGEVTAQPVNQRYSCPRCAMIMMRHQFQPSVRVEVDTCPKCAGVWLDHGELTAIRGTEGTEAQRRAVAVKYIDGIFEKLRNPD